MKMMKVVMYIGLNDQATKRQEITTKEALDAVVEIILPEAGGATISDARGIYTHEDGTTVVENTIRAELFDPPAEVIRRIVKKLKKRLNQESIAVERQEVNTVFM